MLGIFSHHQLSEIGERMRTECWLTALIKSVRIQKAKDYCEKLRG